MSDNVFNIAGRQKMKSSYKTACSVGTIALILAGVAQAEVNKSSLDQWSVTNGVISAGSCPSGFSCAAALADNGFLTRLVKDVGDGKQYFQTIVTMPDATATQTELNTLEFSDENFVSFTNNNGILDKQRLFQAQKVDIPDTIDPNTGNPEFHIVNFTNGSVIGTGWAKDFVELTQTIADPKATQGDGFQTDFIYKSVGYSDPGQSKVPFGVSMKITNYVPLSSAQGAVDRQDFVLVDKQGDYVSNGSVTVGSNTLSWTGDTALNSNSPVRGDHVQALWIGQDLSGIAGQQFGFEAYTNFTTSERVSQFSLSDRLGNAVTGAPGPNMNWDTAEWGDLKTEGTIVLP